MAQAAAVSVVGLRALGHDLGALAADVGPLSRALAAAGQAALAPVAAAAREAIPRESGNLAGSVEVESAPAGAAVRMGAGLLYAGPVEFGGWPSTRPYLPGGRYLFPAAATLESAGVPLYERATQATLDGYPWTNTTSDGGAVHD